MANSYKTLGQLNPSAATLTMLYAVPGAAQAVVSNITIANRSATATSFRISIAVASAADDNKQYIAYDTPIEGNAVITLTLGIGMQTTDEIWVYATLATLSFNATGVEIT